MRLLVTRPEPDASAFSAELSALDHEPILQPLIEFHRLEFDARPLRAAGALVVTSGNALRALQQEVSSRDILDVPLFCVGTETAKRARSIGFRSLAAVADTAEELTAKIISSKERRAPLVHVTGEHQAFDLVGALSREGLSIHTLRVYAMKARDAFESRLVDGIKNGELDGAVLMSARTAEIFVSLCQGHNLLTSAKTLCYFCMAENAAAKLAPLEPNVVHIAAKPNRKALLDLLAHSDFIHESANKMIRLKAP
jgi:uroporphyrinogen-III synthase